MTSVALASVLARADAGVAWLLERLLARLPIGWLQLHHGRARLLAAVGGVAFVALRVLMQLGFQGLQRLQVVAPRRGAGSLGAGPETSHQA